jgi:Predicted amidohydrolase
MSRTIVVGAAQLGPIARADSREVVVARMIALLEKAARRGCDLVVYPELALTTFFPRWFMEDQAEVDGFFETEMPGPATAPLFAKVRELGVAISFGYAEKTVIDGRIRRFNTSIIVDKTGAIVHRYHKVHLPGHRKRAVAGLPTSREALFRARRHLLHAGRLPRRQAAWPSATTAAGRRLIASTRYAAPRWC